ncbi:MAG TPA: ATP-binding protein [Candidatus Nitrosotalea sp.]|nr:ATP-binding protein [Candidatus Nitrosotalea sp.]
MQAGGVAAPGTIEELRLRRDLISSLVLRTLAMADQLSGAALEERIGLPFELLLPLIEEFQRAQLMDSVGFAAESGLEGRPLPARMAYTVSSAGRQRAAEIAAVQTRYLGPCPVRFEDYVELIRAQSSERATITDSDLKAALGELQLDQQVIDQIGGAMISRSSLFIFGAPGNGKSTITERMALIMGDPIEVPHAVAVGDEIIRVFDPVYHRLATGEQPADRRLVRIQRPVVMAGGELRLNQLDLTYDTANRYYEAPLQWKANGGVFVVDDFGRQEVSPMHLLNRFIVPMEKRIDYLDLSASGRKIELPFLCQIVFSTNLSPASLVDEAFLRRMAYKIGVSNPSPEAFTRILQYECGKNQVPWVPQAMPFLLSLYERDQRPMRGSHPRQIVNRLVDFAAYRQLPPRLTPQSLEEAYEASFHAALGGVVDDDWSQPTGHSE